MNWVGSAPSTRTKFEQFLAENFGLYANLSSGEQLVIGAILALAVPALFVIWARSSAR